VVELPEFVAAALRLQTGWIDKEIPFCFIGGLSVQRWSEPRYTRDVDATVFVGFGHEREMAQDILDTFHARIDDPLEFALLNRVLLIEDNRGCPIDLSLGAMPFELEMIERSTLELIDAEQDELRICSPSDLVILKTFAGRPQDWLDVRGTIVRSASLLDWELIEEELRVLLELKEEIDSLERLQSLRRELT
jgi:hypothetical protein